jgi:hypothetical protein
VTPDSLEAVLHLDARAREIAANLIAPRGAMAGAESSLYI